MADDTVLERRCALDPAGLSAREARVFLRDLLVEAGREDWLDAAQLAVSEVVANVVLHAHTRFELTARLQADHLRVEVLDHNPALPTQRSYDEQATTGRGMELVAAVTSAHGVQSLGADGKIVWFCVGGGPTEEPSADDLLDMWDEGGWDSAPAAPDRVGTRLPVVLRNMPVTLWLAARQHHDALLRELALYRATHPSDAGSAGDLALADEARTVISTAVDAAVSAARESGTAARPLPDNHPAPLPEVPGDLDLVLHVGPDRARAFAALQDVLDAAERLAIGGSMLVRPGLPEVIALRDWACEQVIAQLGGTGPGPWPGADHELFTRLVHDGGHGAEEGWDEATVRESDRGVVAADDANRIVAISRTLAAELGWDVEQLVGRRVVVLVPPRFREAHVAGFTRHLTTGEAHVLGVELDLPVLRRDGSEVQCSFLIESTGTPSGRSLYVAWITPHAG